MREPINLAGRLRQREMQRPRPGTHGHQAKLLYVNICPNTTIFSISTPAITLRKFSPDGRCLLAFGRASNTILLYHFKGPTITNAQLLASGMDAIQSGLFNELFREQMSVTVAPTEALYRDFSLFAHHGRFVIVATTHLNTTATAQSQVAEDVTLHVIDAKLGVVSSQFLFPSEGTSLLSASNVYIYEDLLAVTSSQNHSIHILQLKDDGRLFKLRQIGPGCYEDDSLTMANFRTQLQMTRRSSSTASPALGAPSSLQAAVNFQSLASLLTTPVDTDGYANDHRIIGGFRHRILVFLYRKAVLDGKLRQFFSRFDQYLALSIIKSQLIDKHHLLVKLALQEFDGVRGQADLQQTAYFVVYNMSTTEVIAVYNNHTEEFLRMVEHNYDFLRMGSFDHQYPCSCASNIYAQDLFHKSEYSVSHAKNGGRIHSIMRMLSVIPFSAQDFTWSPYLDLSLFSYDDKTFTASDKTKPMVDFPLKFHSRKTGSLRIKFSTTAVDPTRTSVIRARRFIFHPWAPIMLSINYHNNGSFINVHLREEPFGIVTTSSS